MLKESRNKRLSNDISDKDVIEPTENGKFSFKNYVLGVIGLKRRKTTARISDTSKTLQRHEAEHERPPITAKQLHDYYVSLKNENSNLYEDLASVKTSTKGNAEFDSFSINNKAAESTMIKDTVGPENSNNAGNRVNEEQQNDIITPALETDVNMDSVNSSLLPDPIERANLIQLKKMLEIERYKKLKMSYLREHTRHVDRSGISKVAKDIRDRKRDFTLKKSDNTASKRKNKARVYGISLLDTVIDNEEEDDCDKKSENCNIKSNTNISEKIKFKQNSDLDRLDVINERKSVVSSGDIKKQQLSASATSKLPSGSASKFANNKNDNEISEFTTVSAKNMAPVSTDRIEEVTPSSGFVFGASSANSEVEKKSAPSTSFSLSSHPPTDEGSLGSTLKNTFSFTPTAPNTEKDSTSQSSAPFSFADTKPVGGTLGNKVRLGTKNPTNGSNTFNFSTGSESKANVGKRKVTLDTIADADGLGGAWKKKSSAPFTDTTKKQNAEPAFKFGESVTKKEENPAASGFSFGQPVEKQEQKPATSGFSFSQSAEKKDKTAASGFSFGQPAAKNENKPANTGFSFGQPAEKKEEKSAASGFSFGQPAEKNDKPVASGFSFGQPAATNENKPAASGFSFSQPAEKKEDKPVASGFSFNQPVEEKDEKPTASGFSASGFSFSQPAEKNDKPAASGFSFGQPAEKKEEKPTASGFSFGQPAEKKEDKPAASGLSFGKSSTKNESKPVGDINAQGLSSFGGEKKPATAFNFSSATNASTTATNSVPSASGFSFENKSQTNVGFGTNNTTPGFGQPSSNTASSGFAQALSNAAPSGFGQPTSGNGFGFGSGPVSTVNSGTATPTPGFTFGLANNQNNSDASNNKIFSFNGGNFPPPPQNTLAMNTTNSNSNANANANANANINTGFGAGAQSFGMNSTGFGGLSSGPPNINFTGGQTGGMDPSMIFQQNQNNQGATPPPGRANRRIAPYRSRRGGRQ